MSRVDTQRNSSFIYIMSELRKKLVDIFKETGLAQLNRSSQECRSLFKSLTMEEFVERLQLSDKNPDVVVDGPYFKIKPKYPVKDKESLKKYMLE